jgi:hypothetical protein
LPVYDLTGLKPAGSRSAVASVIIATQAGNDIDVVERGRHCLDHARNVLRVEALAPTCFEQQIEGVDNIRRATRDTEIEDRAGQSCANRLADRSGEECRCGRDPALAPADAALHDEQEDDVAYAHPDADQKCACGHGGQTVVRIERNQESRTGDERERADGAGRAIGSFTITRPAVMLPMLQATDRVATTNPATAALRPIAACT